MPATLTINGQTTAAVPGLSLFEHAERLGVRVPTSCKKQGKCKECLVEVDGGPWTLLSPPTPEEQHLQGPLPPVVPHDDRGRRRRGPLPHDAARPDAHRSPAAPTSPRGTPACALDPAVTRDGDRILIDGEEVARSTGPIHGLAMDLGTTTVVLRLFDLETGELVADASFENPQRFGGSDVMARIHYDTEQRRQPADADAGRLHQPRHRGVPGRSADDLRDGRRRQLDDARPVLPPERVLDRPEPVPVDHRDRDGGRQARHDQPGGQRPPAAAADPSARRASTGCRSSAATSAPTPRPACSRSIWRTRIASTRSWTSAPTPS